MLLAEATAAYDLVLIDSRTVLSISDAIPLASEVDAAIVVAWAEFSTRDADQPRRQAPGRLSAVTVPGVVANAVSEDRQHRRPDSITSAF